MWAAGGGVCVDGAGGVEFGVGGDAAGDASAPYQIEFFPTALTNVARQTKHLPVEWVVNGNDLSAEYMKYARPLVGMLPKPGKLF